MNRQELIERAARITPPSIKSASEYGEKSQIMAAELNMIMSARPDLDSLIGKNNRDMMEDNHRNHARFISSLILDYRPDVLVDTVIWVFRAYRAHGFKLTYWPAQLDIWVNVLKKHLSQDAYQEIYPIYDFMIVNQALFARLSTN
ncbi:hypothetical protein [Desulfonatronovibrio hydrogenovorans]|uniref:hypothetical protein n=1 Tax=Desulfonatronovibrio hydrogenovorans TaxID=53245 RepID=UPI000557627E|nr:hypothetical protein [Desulfonatronovibrio hydrogenovorans]